MGNACFVRPDNKMFGLSTFPFFPQIKAMTDGIFKDYIIAVTAAGKSVSPRFK
jgi:hypothetical protein